MKVKEKHFPNLPKVGGCAVQTHLAVVEFGGRGGQVAANTATFAQGGVGGCRHCVHRTGGGHTYRGAVRIFREMLTTRSIISAK